MKSYIVYTRNTEEVVNADDFEIGDDNKVFFYIKAERDTRANIVAVFNLNVIDGFKETELLTE